ncbi:LOW QUALITY PROTEIN: late embryogenesis abundant protein D-34-like [Typha angustifolia]|uniref:LOW QUALITY PROTEIN: late embryogenesis abundant protein D-34-like n=1 Tax=Typha angustifolia TaxID=59011 RepID=UPI003C2B9CF8
MVSTILRRTTESSRTYHFLLSTQARKMSQQQPRRPQQGQGQNQDEPIKYGDVFPVGGDLADDQTIAPQDAAMMQSAENIVMGQTRKGGPAAVMQSAATVNERVGAVRHDQASDIPREQGVTVTETRVPGGRVVTEFVAGQAVGQCMEADPTIGGGGVGAVEPTKLTIGEALEAAAIAAGNQPVEQSDAAAVQAAEARATGSNVTLPGGVAAEAQAAADSNVWALRDEEKTKLGDVLSDAAAKLPADKPVERDDAARVVGAEMRNKPDATTRPGGVAASVAAAARLNRDTI